MTKLTSYYMLLHKCKLRIIKGLRAQKYLRLTKIILHIITCNYINLQYI